MEYYLYSSDRGSPSIGLSPIWNSLVDSGGPCDGGNEIGKNRKTYAPTIYEVGGGFYKFDIAFGAVPWIDTTRELLGVIDFGITLGDNDRYKAIVITKRGLALALMAHRGEQNKTTNDVLVYGVDDVTPEVLLQLTDDGTNITREIIPQQS